MKLYALNDKKAMSLSSFHVERSDAVATRGFAEAVIGNGSSVFAKYPQDFELVCLCDVSQDYEGLSPLEILNNVEFRVVVTAQQVVDMQPKSVGQLSLLEEA
ncbi:MAG: hypothetical protein [Microviridae sp.]|nr:MAG: hypothetical protein [Microviridae sp.]